MKNFTLLYKLKVLLFIREIDDSMFNKQLKLKLKEYRVLLNRTGIRYNNEKQAGELSYRAGFLACGINGKRVC